MSENQDTPVEKALDAEQKKIIADTMADNFVTADEFKEFMSTVQKDLEVTTAELKAAKVLYEKGLTDNQKNIIAIAEINRAYSSNVPAKVYTDTVREINQKNKEMLNTLFYAFVIAMIIFFLSVLLPALGVNL